jgi:PAS domain-containing protein
MPAQHEDGLIEYTITGETAIAFLCESPVGHAVIDKNNVFLWVNQAYCDVLNARREQVIGTTWMRWTHGDELPLDKELAAKVASGEIRQYQLIKKYRQLGSTPEHPRLVIGKLIVFGNFDDDGNLLNFRVTFDPYIPDYVKHDFTEYIRCLTASVDYLVKNWKTVLAILTILGSSTQINFEKLSQILQAVQQSRSESVESASGSSEPSSSPSHGPSGQN